nr:unnamed protein product [Digitaria exilis]
MVGSPWSKELTPLFPTPSRSRCAACVSLSDSSSSSSQTPIKPRFPSSPASDSFAPPPLALSSPRHSPRHTKDQEKKGRVFSPACKLARSPWRRRCRCSPLPLLSPPELSRRSLH